MSKLSINWREELLKLFPETTQRIKGENDEWCPVCHGIGMRRSGEGIVGCSACNGTGISKLCTCCGQAIDRPLFRTTCDCCFSKERQKKQEQKERELFAAATKCHFDKYEGLFLWNDRAITKNDLEEEIYSLIYDGEEPPTYIWGTKKSKVFSNIDLKEIVADKCEDGYEDMRSYFDYKDENFVKAQELLNIWLEKHDSATYIYYEDHETVVLLDAVTEEIKQQIEQEKAALRRIEHERT